MTTDGDTPPRIVFKLPAIDTFCDLMQRAGMTNVDDTRTFATEGPLDVAQVAALLRLAERREIKIRVEGVDEDAKLPLDWETWWHAQQDARPPKPRARLK